VVHISAHCDHSRGAEPVTYDSYLDTLTSSAEYAEFDIRKTADNVLVVYHDGRAGRGGPLVADLGYRELCDRLHYVVPRVDEVMALLAGRLIGHLDLKEIGYEEDVVALASSILGAGNFVVTTLEDASVATIKRAFPQVRTALSLGRSLRGVPRRRWAAVRHSEMYPLSRIRACGADWVAVNYRLARLGVARTCHRNGIGIMVWTVDHDVLIDQFLTDQRIDVLITNRPGHAARRRTELGLDLASGGRAWRLGRMPVGGEHAEDDQVGESPVDPGRAAQAAFRHEPGPGRHRDHRGVVGQCLRLEPLQAENGEAVTAEHPDRVRPQATATEPWP
jgi:glycerophosphoryl diester phosphodiesterase